jgi:hypothetical protein
MYLYRHLAREWYFRFKFGTRPEGCLYTSFCLSYQHAALYGRPLTLPSYSRTWRRTRWSPGVLSFSGLQDVETETFEAMTYSCNKELEMIRIAQRTLRSHIAVTAVATLHVDKSAAKISYLLESPDSKIWPWVRRDLAPNAGKGQQKFTRPDLIWI